MVFAVTLATVPSEYLCTLHLYTTVLFGDLPVLLKKLVQPSTLLRNKLPISAAFLLNLLSPEGNVHPPQWLARFNGHQIPQNSWMRMAVICMRIQCLQARIVDQALVPLPAGLLKTC
jgi:hypothetical protein